MTDLSEIKSVKHTTDREHLNFLLANGGVILNSAGGKWQDNDEAHILYSVGFKIPEKEIPVKPSRTLS